MVALAAHRRAANAHYLNARQFECPDGRKAAGAFSFKPSLLQISHQACPAHGALLRVIAQSVH